MNALMTATFYLAGLIAGFALILAAGRLADSRVRKEGTTDAAQIFQRRADKTPAAALFMANLNAAAWALTYVRYGLSVRSVFVLAAISFALVISSTDLRLRQIPNSLILILLGAGALVCSFDIFGHPPAEHLLGLGVGALMFLVPYLIGSQIGAGDVKYTGAVGLFLGYPGILYAAVVLSAVLLGWILVMAASRRSVMKKSIALAPFISVAFAATLLIYT